MVDREPSMADGENATRLEDENSRNYCAGFTAVHRGASRLNFFWPGAQGLFRAYL